MSLFSLTQSLLIGTVSQSCIVACCSAIQCFHNDFNEMDSAGDGPAQGGSFGLGSIYVKGKFTFEGSVSSLIRNYNGLWPSIHHTHNMK